MERPHVSMLDRSEARRLCWHCFRALLAPVPCPGCSGVLFCGPGCRQEATEAYHGFECGLTELFFQASVGCWPLAYREDDWPNRIMFKIEGTRAKYTICFSSSGPANKYLG